tara:strand:+ start:526 stop:702 length:177 start_codon:yes stop_codon:yes gene_type:complete
MNNSNIIIGSSIFIILLIVLILYIYRDKIPFLNTSDDPEASLAAKGIFVQSGLIVEQM